MIFDIDICEEKIGYTFRDKILLRTSFTHISYANEHSAKSNENLEYLGDSILNFVVAEYLYDRNLSEDEGFLTQRRAELVSAKPLSAAALEMDIASHMLLGAGESKSKPNLNISADLFEAIIAAIYLDGGIAPARKFIYEKLLKNVRDSKGKEADYKSKLQELVQKRKMGRLEYVEGSKTGPDHSPVFNCILKLDGKEFSRASGKSKKEAEKAAAQAAFNKLSENREEKDLEKIEEREFSGRENRGFNQKAQDLKPFKVRQNAAGTTKPGETSGGANTEAKREFPGGRENKDRSSKAAKPSKYEQNAARKPGDPSGSTNAEAKREFSGGRENKGRGDKAAKPSKYEQNTSGNPGDPSGGINSTNPPKKKKKFFFGRKNKPQ